MPKALPRRWRKTDPDSNRFVLADDLHLGLQLDAALRPRVSLDRLDQRQHLRRRGPTLVVDDEVPVNFADPGRTDGGILEPEFIESLRGRSQSK